MTVKIVTDTLSDITGDLAAKLDVTLIPLYVRFGEEIYRDRVEITSEETDPQEILRDRVKQIKKLVRPLLATS